MQTRFPYIKPPTKPSLSFWKEAAHGITSLSKNWDRKAFIAWSINPHEVNQDLKSQRSRGRPAQAGQTIGFTPVIDSYEAWYGGDWASRKEVVAWGAGAALFMRSKIMGKNKSLKWQTSDKRLLKGMNTHKQRYAYSTYSEKGADEGLDDITSVNLLLQQSLNDPEQIIIGRASRGLSLISLSTETSQSKIVSSYDTLGRAVRSATTKLGSIPLLAACLSDSTIALYPIDPKVSQVHPISQVSANPSDQSRTWSSRFLGHERLIVGLGPSQEPLHVYNIGQGEILRESVRALELSHISAHERMDLGGGNGIRSATSIYSLAPIDVSSSAGRAEGDVFLSGAYDGLTWWASSIDRRSWNSHMLTRVSVSMTYAPRIQLQLYSRIQWTLSHRYILCFQLALSGLLPAALAIPSSRSLISACPAASCTMQLTLYLAQARWKTDPGTSSHGDGRATARTTTILITNAVAGTSFSDPRITPAVAFQNLLYMPCQDPRIVRQPSSLDWKARSYNSIWCLSWTNIRIHCSNTGRLRLETSTTSSANGILKVTSCACLCMSTTPGLLI